MADRTYEFGRAVIAEYRRQAPGDLAERVLWYERLKTQKSMATNTAESRGAHTRKDFILKFQIGLKESREAFQLLRQLEDAAPQRRQQLAAFRGSCNEISPSW